MMDDKYLTRIWIALIILVGFAIGAVVTCSMHQDKMATEMVISGNATPAEARQAISSQVPSAEILGIRAIDALKNK